MMSPTYLAPSLAQVINGSHLYQFYDGITKYSQGVKPYVCRTSPLQSCFLRSNFSWTPLLLVLHYLQRERAGIVSLPHHFSDDVIQTQLLSQPIPLSTCHKLIFTSTQQEPKLKLKFTLPWLFLTCTPVFWKKVTLMMDIDITPPSPFSKGESPKSSFKPLPCDTLGSSKGLPIRWTPVKSLLVLVWTVSSLPQ